MTKAQTFLYWREWNSVVGYCKFRNLPAPDRHELHERALGGPKSSKAFTNADLDLVLAGFRAIYRPHDVNTQLRQQAQPTRRLHWKLRDTLACFALYPLTRPMGDAGALAYAREIVRDKVDAGSWRNVTDLEDLSDTPNTYTDTEGCLIERPSQVMQMVMTLSARLNVLRNAAGHSLHDMKIAARVRCTCSACAKRKAGAGSLPVRPRVMTPEGEVVEQPF